MADEEQLRSRSTFADLLSLAQVNSIVAGAVHDHDEPVEGEAEKGHAGQEYGIASGHRCMFRLL